MAKKKVQKKSKKKVPEQSKKVTLQESFGKLLEFKYLGLLIAGVYFIVLLIISLLYHKVGDYGVETDFFWGYVPEAKSFINGYLKIDPFRGPFYPIVLGLVNLIISNYFISGILIGIVSASFVIFLSYEIIKRIFSPLVALFVTLILAVNPIFVQYSYSAGTDMIFCALATATMYFFLKSNTLNYKNLIIAAILGGLSYLTRYNGVFLFGFVVVILFINYWNISWTNRIKSSVVFVAVFILTFTPWGIYCLNEKGSFFYNENYKNIAYELFYGKGQIAWDEFWFKESSNFTSLPDVVTRDFSKFISMIIGNIGEHFLLDMERMMGWFAGAFVILGLLLLFISRPYKNWKSIETGYYLSNLFFFGLLLLIFYSERFSIFLIPFYTLLAIKPLFSEKFLLKKLPVQIGYLLAIALVTVTLAKSISFNSSRINSGPQELLILKDWYDNNVPQNERGKKLAARKPHVAYYLDMEFSLLPLAENYNELLEKLKENNVDYLYFSPIEEAMRREFQSLLDPKLAHPGLEVVVYFNNPPSVLYKLKK